MKPKIKRIRKVLLSFSIGLALVLAPIVVFLLNNTKEVEAGWFDDSWQYRTRLGITNTGQAVTNQKVKFDIDTAALITAGKIQSDCGDSRFTTANGELLRYYIDTAGGACNTSSTDYYVLIPSINAGSVVIYHYYGNPTTSNGTETSNFSETTFSPNSSSAGSEEIGPGPIGYWKFDEGVDNTCSGGTKDACNSGSGGANLDGTISGMASPATTTSGWTASGKFGKALLFDGTNDYLSVADNTSLDFGTAPMTISVWFKTNNTTTEALLMDTQNNGVGNGVFIEIRGDQSVDYIDARFYTSAGNFDIVTSSNKPSVSDNLWHHLVFTRTGTTVALYLDGLVVGQTTDSARNMTNTNALAIGATSDGTAKRWSGSMDEVKIYNYGFTAQQVKAEYNRNSSLKFGAENTGQIISDGAGNPPVAEWHFNEKYGTNAYDTSSSAINGVLGADGVGTDLPRWELQGKTGTALSFDGTDDYVQMPDSSSLSTSNKTYEAWIKTSDADGYVLAKATNSKWEYGILVESGVIRINTYQCAGADHATTTGSKTVNDNQWHHIALVQSDNSYLRLYVDGKLDNSSTSFTGSQCDSDDVFYVGRRYNGVFLSGIIDEVRMFNYARTAQQVAFDYSQGEPLAYWKFDEGVSNTCAGGTNDACNSGGIGTTGDIIFSDTTPPTWTTSGKYKNGASFITNKFAVAYDGTWVQFGTGDFTFSTWVYPRTVTYGASNQGTLISKNYTGFELGIYQGGLTAYLGGSSVCAGGSLSVNNWYHVVMTRTSSTIKIYLNGDLICTNTSSANVSNIGQDVYIGTRPGASNAYLDGILDETKLFNYGLSENEIMMDYNHGSSIVLGAENVGQSLSNGSGNAPVANWNFNEKTNQTVNDSSSNAYNGTLGANSSAGSDDPKWVSGKIGSALNFDGNDDSVATSDIDITGGITINAWIKTSSTDSQIIVRKTVSYELAVLNVSAGCGATGTVLVLIGNGTTWGCNSTYSATSAVTVNDGKWHFITGTYDDATNTIKVYVDGILSTTNSSASVTLGGNTYVTYIGRDVDGSTTPFSGIIDDVKMYNYARTPEQVAFDYNRGAPIGQWKFDECQGSTAYDYSPNSNDGFNGNNGTITIGGTGTYTSAGSCGSGTSTEAWNGGTTGKFNSSIALDGTNDYISMGTSDTFNLTGSFSLSAWAKRASTARYDGIIQRYGGATNFSGYGFRYSNTIGEVDKLCFWVGGSSNTWLCSSRTVTDTNWHHVAATWDGTTRKIYLDGILVGSSVTTASLSNSGDTLYIGSVDASNSYFSGQLDDVRIYNYTLSDTQIKEIYNGGASLSFQ